VRRWNGNPKEAVEMTEKECEECGKENYAHCSFCGKVLCYSCLHKHVPICEDYLQFEAKMIAEGRWDKEAIDQRMRGSING